MAYKMKAKVQLSSQLAAAAAALALLLAVLYNAHLASADAYGKATYYTEYVPSACFGYDQSQFPADGYFGAASDAFWNGGGVCGDYYWVWCTSGCTNTNPIKVRIVDYCPAGCAGTIDLSQAAFSAIANLDTGVIQIGYNFANSG